MENNKALILHQLLEAFRSLRCLNCGDDIVFSNDRSRLFCSEVCKETAKIIRYGRSIYRDGRINQPDVREAWNIKWTWAINGAAYPRKERCVPDSIRSYVFERDNHCCRICGGPATEIDHLNKPEFKENPNHPDNLQALCSACHRKKSLSAFRQVESFDDLPPDVQRRYLELRRRLESPFPLRLCDDEKQWKNIHRQILAERQKILDRQAGASKA